MTKQKWYKITIPPQLLAKVQDRRLEKEFRDFLWAKHQYRNSEIYNYTTNSASKKLGWSRTKVERLVRIFLEQGWCEITTSGSLKFRNLCEIYKIKTDNKKVRTTVTMYLSRLTPAEIFRKLNLELLRIKLRQIGKSIEVKKNLKFPETLSAYKAAQSYVRQKAKCMLSNDVILYDMRVSQAAMTKLFKRHRATVSRRIQLLRGLVAIQYNEKLLYENVGYIDIKEVTEYTGLRNTFMREGNIYKRESNSYAITFAPRVLPKSGKVSAKKTHTQKTINFERFI